MSGGTVFLIILACVIPVYIIGGCIYKRQKMGTTGVVESCPNVDFWRALPGFIKEVCASPSCSSSSALSSLISVSVSFQGCCVTWGKLRACCGGKPAGDYETVK
jgi:hypothetical protein